MATLESLVSRLDAEFKNAEKRVEEFQLGAQKVYEERQQRYQRYLPLFEKIREMAQVRLEALITKFPDLKVKRGESRYGQEAQIYFASPLASVKIRFAVCHDEEVRNVALDYHLEILPIFIKFEPHSRFEQPLDSFDLNAAAAWLDDRLVSFVQTYLSMQFAASYQAHHLVSDPVAGINFPESFTKATLEFEGQKYYFISEETKKAFLADKKLTK
ncbi:MAG: hypothetical protein U1D30_20510 [Planctomycetota bacterium]